MPIGLAPRLASSTTPRGSNGTRRHVDSAGWQAELDVNLRAPVFLTQAFARALPQNAAGCVINMIDQRVWRLTPDFFSYTIAKVRAVDRDAHAGAGASPRIRVNASVQDRSCRTIGKAPPEFERECRSTPLGQGATPEEICAAIDFLLATPSVTGQMIALDGGQHLAWQSLGKGEASRASEPLKPAALRPYFQP